MAKIVLDSIPKTIMECPFRKGTMKGFICQFTGNFCNECGNNFDNCPACTTLNNLNKKFNEIHEGEMYLTILDYSTNTIYEGIVSENANIEDILNEHNLKESEVHFMSGNTIPKRIKL